jgi:hypothetical protein
MDLRILANAATQNVNPNTPAVIITNQGWVTDAAGHRTPVTATTAVTIQIQAMDQGLIRHTDGLNITGIVRSIYIYYPANSVVRVTGQGGDIVQFSQILGGTVNNWLVTHVIEEWQSTNAAWSHVLCTLQT